MGWFLCAIAVGFLALAMLPPTSSTTVESGADVLMITRAGAFAGAPQPKTGTEKFVNCHETNLHLVVQPKEENVASRKRLAYTMMPEIKTQQPTDKKTKFCYFGFVHDSNFTRTMFLSKHRPSFSFPLHKTTPMSNTTMFGTIDSVFADDENLMWTSPSNSKYSDTLGVVTHAIPGYPYLVMRGILEPKHNSRPLDQAQIVDWKVLYSQLGDVEHVMHLQQGRFTMGRKSLNSEEGILISGDNNVDVNVQGFEEGWIALVVRVSHVYPQNTPQLEQGSLSLADDIQFQFSPPTSASIYLNKTATAKQSSTWFKTAEARKNASSTAVNTQPPPISATANSAPLLQVLFDSFENAFSGGKSDVKVQHVGESCSPKKPVKFSKTLGNGKEMSSMRFEMGTGLKISGFEKVLNTGDFTTFSISMMVKFERTSCHVRLLNVNPEEDNGLYLCDGLQLQPEPPAGDPLKAMQWYHIVITTNHLRQTKLYVNGALEKDWKATRTAWKSGLRISGKEIYLFNDCGRCPCNSTEDSAAWIAHLGLYNFVVDDSTVKALYAQFDSGIVSHFDFSTGSLSNLVVGAPAIKDVGSTCGRASTFTQGLLANSLRKTLSIQTGTGLVIPEVSALTGMKSGEETAYTLLIKASVNETSCSNRFFTTHASTTSQGLYFCNDLRIFPIARDSTGFGTPSLTPNRFHTIAVSTWLDKKIGPIVRVFINGTYTHTFAVPRETWMKTFMVENSKDSFISLFNNAQTAVSCGSDREAGSPAVDIAEIMLFNRVLSYSEIELAVQKMQSDTNYGASNTENLNAGYLLHQGVNIPAVYDAGTCRGGFGGCSRECDNMFDCVGFTLVKGDSGSETSQGMLKSVWFPTVSQATDLYRKLSRGPVLDLNALNNTITSQITMPRTISSLQSFGLTNLSQPLDVASQIVDKTCKLGDSVFKEEDMGRGYWKYAAEWVPLGRITSTTGSNAWSTRCRDKSLEKINNQWKLKVVHAGKTNYFMGAEISGSRASFCDALAANNKHLWSPSEDGDFHIALDIGPHAGIAYKNWPPQINDFWGTSFDAWVKWPTYVALFPTQVLTTNKGVGIAIPKIGELVPTQDYTSYSFVMQVKFSSLPNSCVRIFDAVGTSANDGLFVCNKKITIKAGDFSVAGSRTLDVGRWYRIALSTSPRREITLHLNDYLEINTILSAEAWKKSLRIPETPDSTNNYLTFFNSQGFPPKCNADSGTSGVSLRRLMVFDRPLVLDEVSALFEMLRVKCAGEPEECSGHGECTEGVCQCSHEDPVPEDPCTRQQQGTSNDGCNSKSKCGDPLFCEYCDYCPFTQLCYSGPTLRCFEHNETLVLSNAQAVVAKPAKSDCVSYQSNSGLSAKDYCAYRCSIDKTCTSYVVESSGRCCMKESFDLARTTPLPGSSFYKQSCPSQIELCSATLSKRAGATRREKCIAMDRCVYRSATDSCEQEDVQVGNFPAGWKNYDCSVPSCVGQQLECYGRGVCLTSASNGLSAGECQCFESSDKTLAQFKGTSPRYGDNQCAVRRCPGDSPTQNNNWIQCNGHGACDGCSGECVCDADYRGTSPSGWGWDCSVRRCAGDNIIQGPFKTNTTSAKAFSNINQIDWSGKIRYKVNMRGPAIEDWTPDYGTSGFGVYGALNTNDPPNTPSLGNSALQSVMSSSRWTASSDLLISMNVSPKSRYRLQLLFYEACCNRGFDIEINGEIVARDFSTYALNRKACAIFTYTLTAYTSPLSVKLKTNGRFADNNPEISAVLLHEITDQFLSELRLVEVPGTDAKRVEAYMYKEGVGYHWGSFCTEGWGDEEATVVCKQLGMGTGTASIVSGGIGPFWYSGCSCTGSEQDISQCCPKGVYTKCSHSSEAGVLCSKFDAQPRAYQTCSGHGACNNGVCVCNPSNYRGLTATSGPENDCSVASCPGEERIDGVVTSVCSKRGTCDEVFRTCKCNEGWHGDACELKSCPGTPFCSEHGTCNTVTGKCQCNVGWGEDDCSKTIWVSLEMQNYNRDESASNSFFDSPQYRYFPEERICKFKGIVVRGNGLSNMVIAYLNMAHECVPASGHLLFATSGADGTYMQRLHIIRDSSACYLGWESSREWVSLESVMYFPAEAGRTRDGLSFGSGYGDYNGGWANPHYVLTSSLCMLQGLVRHYEPNGNTVIMDLPHACKPTGRLIFNAIGGSYSEGHIVLRIDVYPISSGARVQLVAAASGAWNQRVPWMTLSGIVFPVVGRSGALSLASGVNNYGGDYLVPQYYLTPNLCIFNGLSRASGASSRKIATLPAQCRPKENHIFVVNHHANEMRLDAKGDQFYLAPYVSFIHDWLPFDGVCIVRV